ncbi:MULTISPECIES: hypothetical protein [Mycobacterium]|uniref:hypothetical protein n=1 Tax=Mycobacterium TaxID=1763 RepID=UPI000693FF34|nr:MULTISPECIES: hypothetical protein [Mycobacterium]MDA3660176.1 hypothetical protein [Mycobacterium xenopi]
MAAAVRVVRKAALPARLPQEPPTSTRAVRPVGSAHPPQVAEPTEPPQPAEVPRALGSLAPALLVLPQLLEAASMEPRAAGRLASSTPEAA